VRLESLNMLNKSSTCATRAWDKCSFLSFSSFRTCTNRKPEYEWQLWTFITQKMDSLDRGKRLALANLSAVLVLLFIIDSSAFHYLLVTFTKKNLQVDVWDHRGTKQVLNFHYWTVFFSKHYQFIKALDSGKVNLVQRMDVRSRDMWVACYMQFECVSKVCLSSSGERSFPRIYLEKLARGDRQGRSKAKLGSGPPCMQTLH